MKKIGLFLILLTSFLIVPKVYASQTNLYYIEANIQSNGDMHIKELKELNGSYNGVLTNLRYKNTSLKTFTGILEDFDGSSIYNGTSLTDLKVYDVIKNGTNFNMINTPNKEFDLVSYASNGEYGKYTKSDVYNGVDLKIYMPSSYNRLSLVTYTIKDAIVIHNDVAELAWDFISTEYEEDISNLKVIVNLPKDSNELRVFSHGPLNGSNRIINKHSVEMTYDYLHQGNAVDMRVVFDKDIVSEGTKLSNIDGLDKILEVEKLRADKANALREEARAQENRKNTIQNIIKMSFGLWLIGLIIIIYKIYNKHDKEYKAKFSGKYFRDFPNDYEPSTVSYLMYKDINNNSFSASILELIRKKVLLLEEVQVEEKKLFGNKVIKDYKLTLNNNVENFITENEKKVIYLIINTIGNGSSVTLNQIKDSTKNYDDAKIFIDNYNDWKNTALTNAIGEEFYEDKLSIKIKGVLYSLIIPLISFITLLFELNLGIFYLFNIFSIISIIYFIRITKRTQKGNSDYAKWNGLKNFMMDFSKFSDKELPEIKLWERYLVYATVFGIANKVQEVMKIKINEVNYQDTDFTFMYYTDWIFYSTFNNTINTSISTVRNTITTHEMASSTNSSSGGFGGGSSFGGGGFGGGGSSGGRF